MNREQAVQATLSPQQLEQLWAEHIKGEFESKDVEATLATMVEDAYVNHMSVNTGGRGKDALRAFYRDDFIPSWPEDLQMTPVNRVVGQGQLSRWHAACLQWPMMAANGPLEEAGHLPIHTRRHLLALACGALTGLTRSAWAGHPSGRSVVTISAESLKRVIDSRRVPVFLVDLRPSEDYRRGRLPGAISMSVDDIEWRITEVSLQNVVVLYCACPIDDVTPLYERLRNRGYRNLWILQDGFGGCPVEQ
jgi:rhodanese-related sulfurtransferase